MDRNGKRPAARWPAWLVLAPLIVVLAAASFLPLVETNTWWIRFLDFPRLQIGLALLAAVLLFLVLLRRPGAAGWAVIALGSAALGYQIYKLYPYTPLVPAMARAVSDCPAEARLRVLVANVQRSNERADELFAIVAEADPDVLVLLETDEWWDRRLASLEGLPHRIQSIPEDALYFGMHLLSRHPLVDPEVRFFFDADTPSIVAGIALPDGGAIDIVGLHPRPPELWQPTTMRDAHLYAAATEAAGSEAASIVVGDFNAAPWERVNRRAMRIGGLLDPRVGRGLYPSYATDSLVKKWPIDQVLFEDELALLDFRKLRSFGSDHYPMMADLCHAPGVADRQSPPAMAEDDLREAETAMEAARALQD